MKSESAKEEDEEAEKYMNKGHCHVGPVGQSSEPRYTVPSRRHVNTTQKMTMDLGANDHGAKTCNIGANCYGAELRVHKMK